jgi:hypothetical protein
VWQRLHAEFEADGLTVVTVALDLEPEQARSWIERAASTHPSLVDSAHRVDELLGITNVPMAVWIDETGTLVRPAESATIEPSPLRSMEIDDAFPENIKRVLVEAQKIPDHSQEYRAAIADWVTNGSDSRFALSPDEVIDRSQLRPIEHARAAACFELGQRLYRTVGKEAAVPWWKEAHSLHPDNWTYKRQAWTLETTLDGDPSDLLQEVGESYGTSWVEDVVALGGGANYGIEPQL